MLKYIHNWFIVVFLVYFLLLWLVNFFLLLCFGLCSFSNRTTIYTFKEKLRFKTFIGIVKSLEYKRTFLAIHVLLTNKRCCRTKKKDIYFAQASIYLYHCMFGLQKAEIRSTSYERNMNDTSSEVSFFLSY